MVSNGRFWIKTSASYRITRNQIAPYGNIEPFAWALIDANKDPVFEEPIWRNPVVEGTTPNGGARMEQLGAGRTPAKEGIDRKNYVNLYTLSCGLSAENVNNFLLVRQKADDNAGTSVRA